MKILFLGYAVDPEIADGLSGVSVAGNKMQVNVLKGLSSYSDVELKCITVYPVAAFPREKKLWIKGNMIKVAENVNSYRVPFLNLPVVKQIHQTANVYRKAKKLADKDTKVLAFNLFPQIGLPLMWLKKKYGCETYSLLADLPIDDYTSGKNVIRHFFRKIFDSLTEKAIKVCDKLIVLNRNAAEKYAPGTEYIVMEGGIDEKNIPIGDTLSYDKRLKNIIYSGALTEYSGIMNLIKAMDSVKDTDALLEIYGGGYLQDEIEEIAKEKKNVKYCGKVDNKTMLSVQQSAYLLVNPRPVDDKISQVTFPSKIFEYMSSGTAVLSTELNGLTNDYLKNIYHIKSNEPHLLAEKIDEILKADTKTLNELALCAREFILTNKTWKLQSEKIHDFLGKK